jgi:hypothetical protein
MLIDYRGQLFTLLNLHSYITGALFSLVAIASIPSILEVLTSTKKSSTVAAAYRRYKMNGFHSQIWGSGPIEPGTRYFIKLSV